LTHMAAKPSASEVCLAFSTRFVYTQELLRFYVRA
jgi:hypothetical protein